MPAPALAPVLSFENGTPISNISVALDATILRSWRDASVYGTSDPIYPYYGMEIKIHAFRSAGNILLARYAGGKLLKEACYQLRGRYVVLDGGQSYLHVDEAVRFQGPGIVRSFAKPRFLLVGVPARVDADAVVLRWTTRDPYRKGMLLKQSAVFELQEKMDDANLFVGELCCLEGSMDGSDHRRDWVCNALKLC